MNIKQQLFALLNCLGAGFTGFVIGLGLGLGDYHGKIYYDLAAGARIGMILFLAFFIACFIESIKQGGKNV